MVTSVDATGIQLDGYGNSSIITINGGVPSRHSVGPLQSAVGKINTFHYLLNNTAAGARLQAIRSTMVSHFNTPKTFDTVVLKPTLLMHAVISDHGIMSMGRYLDFREMVHGDAVQRELIDQAGAFIDSLIIAFNIMQCALAKARNK